MSPCETFFQMRSRHHSKPGIEDAVARFTVHPCSVHHVQTPTWSPLIPDLSEAIYSDYELHCSTRFIRKCVLLFYGLSFHRRVPHAVCHRTGRWSLSSLCNEIVKATQTTVGITTTYFVRLSKNSGPADLAALPFPKVLPTPLNSKVSFGFGMPSRV